MVSPSAGLGLVQSAFVRYCAPGNARTCLVWSVRELSVEGEVADPLPVRCDRGPCGGQVLLDLAFEVAERLRDLAARCRLVRTPIRLCEVSVLGCCGGVGAVVG